MKTLPTGPIAHRTAAVRRRGASDGAVTLPPSAPCGEPILTRPAGRVVASRYRLRRLLGRGGMGAVWLADAGASVALAGLLGAVCAWLLSPAVPPRSRHDRADRGALRIRVVRLGQANAVGGLRIALAVASVAAALVALAGGLLAFRGPASSGVLHDRQARRRYGLAVGVEFALAGAGAAVLAVAGQGAFIPVWVCAVVGVHFFALASLLEDRLLVPLGASVTTVALVALVAALAAGIAPSTVTGVGAGAVLTGFAVAALADGQQAGRSRP